MLSENLRNINVGVYLLKLAKSYTKEHLNNDSEFIIMINSDIENILRVQIQSRHTSSIKYLIWIEYDEIEIKAWYCQCKTGSRVVGTCAHVKAVLWYLGFARHMGKQKGIRDWAEFVEDAAYLMSLTLKRNFLKSDILCFNKRNTFKK
ncbi:Hypothetical predicted protein [Mytilus galloprovincialis]|uniref:SWIM-type domain-containing protein n=1 Tax=Mytilus galloprovincialis TaxID=29158 RepID=A0A8B6DRQ6_MYTGA|nr:Hypothetical predicted protein [Mytilus galloprovincialis]